MKPWVLQEDCRIASTLSLAKEHSARELLGRNNWTKRREYLKISASCHHDEQQALKCNDGKYIASCAIATESTVMSENNN